MVSIRVCIAIALVFAGAGRAAGAESGNLASGGFDRTFTVEAPEHPDPSRPLPLVLVLHGAGGNGANALAAYRWDEAARRENFIAAAPDAMPALVDQPASFMFNPRYWNDGSARGPEAHMRVDDATFLGTLIDQIARKYPVDRHRVYVTGFSSGASMTHRAGLVLADRLAAIAPVAGKSWTPTTPSRAVPVLYVVGDSDPLTPLAGGPVKLPWGGKVDTYPPARELPETWAKLDHCQAPVSEHPSPALSLEAWRHCGGDAEVLFYTIASLGHEWAGGRGRTLPASMTGPYSDAVDTTRLIWDFFLRHRLE
ncbi:MAG TPA: PHB depolymerase family esterase [Candidatus Cybelea sp.]|nr:PHB depolymerase family esterase [Candidatus Cybelea sp.]